MGRSRAASQAAVDDPGQSRSKRKRTTQNVDNTDSATPELPGITDGKKALYHCNYCNKDISGKIRIKCVVCSDFDLCIECFSVGAEVYPHKSNHPYRVMDNLAFPLICPDWNADEEMLLLEGLEMYGLGNWNEVAEHVGTKSKSQCIDHYDKVFMKSSCFPLPDMSHVMGKSREELLAMAKEHGETKEGATALGEVDGKEQSPFSARIKIEDQRKEGPSGRSSSISSEVDTIGGKMSAGAIRRMSSEVPSNDGLDTIKVEEFQSDRSIGEKKPRTSGDEGVSMKELSGYNSKRQEFEVEYDNDAEQLLADMEFKETDTDAERELKLRVLHIYLKRLDERKRRKDFILERNLLYPDPFEKDLTSEEKELCRRYRVFMRFHSKKEHDELLRSVVEEQRILKRIQNLQEARAAGCRTSSEAERYIEQKMKREIEESARRVKESGQTGPSGKYLQRMNHHHKGEQDTTTSPRVGNKSPSVLDPAGMDSSSNAKGLAGSDVSDNWDVTGFLGADILSEAEKQLCGEMRILPAHYLNMLQTMSMGILNGNVTKKSDAHGLFNVDPGKVDKVYDMLIRKGIGIAQT